LIVSYLQKQRFCQFVSFYVNFDDLVVTICYYFYVGSAFNLNQLILWFGTARPEPVSVAQMSAALLLHGATCNISTDPVALVQAQFPFAFYDACGNLSSALTSQRCGYPLGL
jgi:hypothetical protein